MDAEACYALIDAGGALVIDVRDGDYGTDGAVQGARHIPHFRRRELAQAVAGAAGLPVVLYCAHGLCRSPRVAEDLRERFPERQIAVLPGGFNELRAARPDLVVQ